MQRGKWRDRFKNALDSYFRKRTLTRFVIWALLSLTGFCGFFVSYGLLKLGVNAMWIRYPAAVVAAYGVFLGLIRVWVELERARFNPRSAEFAEAVRNAPAANLESEHSFPKPASGKWYDWLDGWGDIFQGLTPDPDGCLPFIIFLTALGLLAVLFVAVLNAETLMAEGFLDTFLVVGLYRRLRVAAREHWLGTTLRKTWGTVAVIAVILAIIGGALQYNDPEAHSIGPALRRLCPS